ncbi:MAG: DUF881 domain-containing protein [Clostridiales bacterium]|nr:DUF881 domain-containing protein [Clostridiales bacterium]
MKSRKVIIFIFCFFLGLSLVVLTKVSNGQRLYVSPKVLEDYRISIEGEKKDMENLKALVEETENKLNEYIRLQEEKEDLSKELEKQLFADIALYSFASGFVAAEGPGVEILIDDGTRDLEFGEDPNDILVHDSDLLLIINELRAAGAEMISVNGQRIIDQTSISCSGYTVRINDQFYARPFIIRAIGDGSRMASTLIGPGGYGTLLKEYGLVFKVTIKDNIVIPEYTENRNFIYMSRVTADSAKEGEEN